MGGRESSRTTSLINVAFAGHIHERDLVDAERCAARLRSATETLRSAGVLRARLLSGDAAGADQLAVDAWRAAGLGPVHIVHPTLDSSARDDIDSQTWLDGAADRAAGESPHLQQARWIVGYADLLVALWNGAPVAGPGGTADTVALALERGLPVVWIQTADVEEPLRLILFQRAGDGFDLHALGQVLARLNAGPEAALPLRAADLAASLRIERADRSPPAEDSAAPSRSEALLHKSLWRAFDLFKRVAGGRGSAAASPPPPPDLADDPGFQVLTRAYRLASQAARRQAAVHRSEQLLLIAVAVLAAVTGASPALWPGLKFYTVLFELAVALGGFLVWRSAQRARRHEQWGESRWLAERIRAQRAGWAIGVAPPRSADPSAPLDIDDRLSLVLGEAGAPEGVLDAERMTRWGDWALADLVAGQARYHAEQARVNGAISLRIGRVENAGFLLLVASLALFDLALVASALKGPSVPGRALGVVVMIGSVVPAIGAASMAIEAKFDFSDQQARSAVLANLFRRLIEEAGPSPSAATTRAIARRAIGLVSAEAAVWRTGAERRRLVRGG